jgi:3-oxoisoapionate kinase
VNRPVHDKLLYAFYGDDFTGSTDVLEALSLHGVGTVLFTHLPTEQQLAAFCDCAAVGIAGESRSRDPRWMNRHLPPVFAAMRNLGAAVHHYKVCSTFDSSPRVGSIGRAMELGRAAFSTQCVPVVVAAPRLGRSVVYGNLFAAAENGVYRIDRHPTMRRHPVTPMLEADLRLHLASQTNLQIGLVDLKSFQVGEAEQRFRSETAAGAEGMLFDGIDDAMLDETARLIWREAAAGPVFAIGSSGLTYGMVRHWRRLGLIGEMPKLRTPVATDRLLVISGSCSPVTDRQIRRAGQQGFSTFHLEGLEPWGLQTRRAQEALARGESVVLYTALGPQPKSRNYDRAFGAALGRCVRGLLTVSGVRRLLIAGGDTSAHAMKELGIDALTFAAPLVSGVPLCRSHAPGSNLDGLEVALKGGQIGPEDFFAQVRDGK